MNFIYWQLIHILNVMMQLMQDSFAKFLEDCHQSTLWIGNNTEETVLGAIAMSETTKAK